jgi:hypothetical protein
VYVNQALSPVLVVRRKHRSLMPQRRRITIRRQSGGGPLHLPRSCRRGLRSRHDLLIRSSRHIVQDHSSRSVPWADIPQLSTQDRRCPAAWQQYWQQSRSQQLIQYPMLRSLVRACLTIFNGGSGAAIAGEGALSSPLMAMAFKESSIRRFRVRSGGLGRIRSNGLCTPREGRLMVLGRVVAHQRLGAGHVQI